MGTKLHPLHTPEWVARYVLEKGEYPGERFTGRSTALALRVIAEAIENPGKKVLIRDHVNLHRANNHLRGTVQEFVRKLGLRHFVFTEDTIKFGHELADEVAPIRGGHARVNCPCPACKSRHRP